MPHRGWFISYRRDQKKDFLSIQILGYSRVQKRTSLESTYIADSESVPPEDRLDRFRDK